MRQFKIILSIIIALAITVSGCGGGGDTEPEDLFRQDPPPTTTPEGGADTTSPVTVSGIELTTSSSVIGTEETAKITVTLFDSSGNLVTSPKEVTFTLDAPALGSISSPVLATNGFTSQTFTARTVEGTVTITAKAANVSASKTLQISNRRAAAFLELIANPTTITVGGTSVVSASVLDSENNFMPDGTTVNFSVDNPALGTLATSASTNDGIAQATFAAGLNSTGTATITATSGSAESTTAINVNGTEAGSIEFRSATPQIVSIQGAGGQETSKIEFLIKDSNGEPIVGSQTVRLELSGPNGGEYLGSSPETQTLDVGTVGGIATVILHSGTIPGTATIKATVVGTNLSTSSGVIAIGGGVPSAGHFSLSADALNLEGGAYDNITDDILVLLADRYGNKNVLTGTTVSFYSECGAVDRAVSLDDIGQGTVVFRTQSPAPRDVAPQTGNDSCGPKCDAENYFIDLFRYYLNVDLTNSPRNPRDGLCTIIAVVDGEEEFTDADANGIYDSTDQFIDTYDDIHLDMDDDPEDRTTVSDGRPHDPSFEDLVVDRNQNGFFEGMNGVWDNNKRISKKIDLLFTGLPRLTTNIGLLELENGGSSVINFALHDSNFNRPIAGTNLSVKVSGPVNLSGTKEYTFIDSNALGTPIHSITLTDGDPETTTPKTFDLEFSWSWKGNSFSQSYTGTIKSKP